MKKVRKIFGPRLYGSFDRRKDRSPAFAQANSERRFCRHFVGLPSRSPFTNPTGPIFIVPCPARNRNTGLGYMFPVPQATTAILENDRSKPRIIEASVSLLGYVSVARTRPHHRQNGKKNIPIRNEVEKYGYFKDTRNVYSRGKKIKDASLSSSENLGKNTERTHR